MSVGVVPVIAATTWTVDDSGGADFTSIQDAVNVAKSGDTISVRDGIYIENVDVSKPHLTIQSENGAGSTIVRSANPGDHVLEVTASWITISGFTVTGATDSWKAGIFLEGANHCTISENTASNNYQGIRLETYSSGNMLSGNTANSNIHDGIRLDLSSGNMLSGNTANSNFNGIFLDTSSENTLTGNTANLNNDIGIYLHLSNGNMLSGNTASNSIVGILLRDSSNSKINRNNFVGNGENVRAVDSTNRWNSQEKITYTYNGNRYTNYLGNYWSDYTRSDTDKDGIGDTPYYIISDGGQNNYPLMEPWQNYITPHAEAYALIIGVNDYDDPKVRDLKFAEKDAVAFYNLLVYGYGYPPDIDSTDNVALLTKFVHKEDIENELDKFQSKVDSNDIFVFYFSGHGHRNDLGEEHIRACDYDISSYDLDLIFDEFEGTVICIFDSCHSGGMTLDTDINEPPTTKYGIDRENAVVLMACEADKLAVIKESIGHALFTNYLYNAFVSDRKASNIDPTSDPNRVSVEEAFIYADKQDYRTIIRGPPFFIDPDPQMMDHYPTKSNPAAHSYLAERPIDPEFLAGRTDCPVHLHAYDSEGRHTGINAAGDDIEEKIPGSFYNGPEYDPEEIIVLGTSDNIIFKIEALDEGSFNFTITKSTDTETKKITYLDVPITEATVATLDVSQENLEYLMEIDYDGDGIIDETRVPDGSGSEPIPEFTTIAIPVAAIIGLLFLFSQRRKKEE
nr:cell surface glycoprotein [uncultured archaeon GZfos27E7]